MYRVELFDPAGQYMNRKNATIVWRAPEVRNDKKSKIIPPPTRWAGKNLN
jgi:hypothetical protein